MRDCGQPPTIFSSVSVSQACGLTALSLAVSISGADDRGRTSGLLLTLRNKPGAGVLGQGRDGAQTDERTFAARVRGT